MSTRTFTGTTKAWITSATPWDMERLKDSNRVNDFTYHDSDMTEYGWVEVGTAEIKVTLNVENKDIVKSQVATLRKQVENIRAEAQMKVNGLENQIKNLMAITYEPEDLS